eukprot:CAMPEP_0178390594 /NCGR_PEP_ID=MMETSP0689_2-20121128/10727_1 /TAXON_ID=160604 /ORGANISM="Amphidinium massartii, Strain CS-259" /LENGTH=317 /DNA_ID=CAMNT_0020011109 /DNA_START=9 /DNA_END=959 /DNA_ORIENTATION=-
MQQSIAEHDAGDSRRSRCSSEDQAEADQECESHSQPPLNSSRGVPEHRADPALRSALEKLEYVRRHQPSASDFALERYMSTSSLPTAAPAATCSVPATAAPTQVSDWQDMSAGFFDCDLLIQAARAVPRRSSANVPPRQRRNVSHLFGGQHVWLNPEAFDVSGSTSPGSTPLSSTLATSAGSLSDRSKASEVSGSHAPRKPSVERNLKPLPTAPREPRRATSRGRHRAGDVSAASPYSLPAAPGFPGTGARALSLDRSQALETTTAQGTYSGESYRPPLPPPATDRGHARPRVHSARGSGSQQRDESSQPCDRLAAS